MTTIDTDRTNAGAGDNAATSATTFAQSVLRARRPASERIVREPRASQRRPRRCAATVERWARAARTKARGRRAIRRKVLIVVARACEMELTAVRRPP
jgi:hypothetical protein